MSSNIFNNEDVNNNKRFTDYNCSIKRGCYYEHSDVFTTREKAKRALINKIKLNRKFEKEDSSKTRGVKSSFASKSTDKTIHKY